MGMTPYAYLRAYRLIKAQALIDGGMSIAAASVCVGYESAEALSRALKKDGLKS
jgi:methylphosphotriester-DNA--protein-cysteine methyltransferase